MAEQYLHIPGGEGQHHLSGCAAVASLAVSGPLLLMMGLTLMASTLLLLVASPLLLLSSPLLLFGGFVLAASLAGFGACAALAYAGTSALVWVFHSVCGGRCTGGVGWIPGMLRDSWEGAKKEETEFGGYLQEKAEMSPTENQTGGVMR